MKVRLVPLNAADEFPRLGVSWQAISEIFLGLGLPASSPSLVMGTPTYAKTFARREYLAGGFSFRAIRLGEIRVPDLWTGEILHCRSGFTSPAQDGLPYDMLPFYYRLIGHQRQEFWLTCYGTYGRITHIFLPAQDVIIYDFDAHAAPVLAEHLARHLEEFRLASEAASAAQRRPGVIAVLDMITNFGHQLMNQLGGVERLLEETGAAPVDQLWLSGVEFFAPIERLFPEVAQKVRRFANRWDMYSELSQGAYLPLRIGTNVFRQGIGDRLKAVSETNENHRKIERHPIIAVTVRTAGRRCLNLPDIIQQTISTLRYKYPRLGIVLDGWVLPDSQLFMESALATIWWDDFYRNSVIADLELARQISEQLPNGTIVANLIGQPMSSSLHGLRGIDTYLSHVGTLQHKISFITGTRGVVHGPSSQLSFPDTGHFQAEFGFAPLFLDPSSVVDLVQGPKSRKGFEDYEIVRVDDVTSKLHEILASDAW
jgi:hypothetical protein